MAGNSKLITFGSGRVKEGVTGIRGEYSSSALAGSHLTIQCLDAQSCSWPCRHTTDWARDGMT